MTRPLLLNTATPLIIAALAIVSEYTGFDLWLASHFYDPVTHSWPYRSLFLTSAVLHTRGRDLIALIAIVNLLAVGASYLVPVLTPYRKHLLFLFVAAITGPVIVGALKSLTHIYTPWDIVLFGGDKPYVRLFDTVESGAEVGHAFPGGHASGGFAYLALYFLATVTQHRLRYYALLPGLLTGIVFATVQEIRGAHFLSHDLFSFAICWTAALAWSVIFYGRSDRDLAILLQRVRH